MQKTKPQKMMKKKHKSVTIITKLVEFLLKKNYIIHGVKRRSSSENTQRIDHLFDSINFTNKNFFLHYGDLTHSTNLLRIIKEIEPDEIYNLGAQSHVKVSFDTWIQLLGMVGVLGGLVFVGLEMQQTQRIAIAGQVQARAD